MLQAADIDKVNVWLTVRTETGRMAGTGPWAMSKDMQISVTEPSGKVPLNFEYMGPLPRNDAIQLFELTLTGEREQKLLLRVTERIEIWNADGSILAILEVRGVEASRAD